VQIIGGMSPRAVAPASGEVRDACSETVGMRDDDETKVGVLGIITGGVQQFASRNSQSHCPLPSDEQYKAQMIEKIVQNLKMSVPSQLLMIPNDYLKRARQLTDVQEAIENYSLFLLSNSNRDSAGTQDALNFIRQHDPDLHPEVLAQSAST